VPEEPVFVRLRRLVEVEGGEFRATRERGGAGRLLLDLDDGCETR
jgi:hypothetical protein